MKPSSEIFAFSAHENDWCKCGCKSELCTMLKDVRNWVSLRPPLNFIRFNYGA